MNFARTVEDLLFLENDFGGLRDAANDFYKYLSEITEINKDAHTQDRATILKNGKAIAPRDAALCVLDFARTSSFLRGIYAAIEEAKRRFPNEKIEILYAGCGPFATLAVPFCLKFSPDEICFTLIDIHKKSVVCAEKFFRTLDFEKFVGEYILMDATVFQPENEKRFHIIVSETMQKSLKNEPQVEMTLNLAKHLFENGLFIPQKIIIEACLADLKKEFSTERQRIMFGKIFELSAESRNEKDKLFSPKTFEISSDGIDSMSLMLLTKVEIFDSFALNDYDSGITYSTIFRDFTGAKAGQKIEFRYVRGNDPRFEYRLI